MLHVYVFICSEIESCSNGTTVNIGAAAVDNGLAADSKVAVGLREAIDS